MELNIHTGAISAPIIRDGAQTGVLRFNPRDVAFVQRFYELLEHYDRTLGDYQRRQEALAPDDAPGYFALLLEITGDIRSGIDDLFGSGTAEAAFGPYSGDPDVFAQFFDAVYGVVNGVRAEQLRPYLPEEDQADADAPKADGLV